MKTLTAALGLALWAVAACAPQNSFPPVDTPQALGQTPAAALPAAPSPAAAAAVATCAGTDILALIGQNVSKLPATGTWSTVRILKPGDAATMDFSPTRLNVNVDKSGTIQSLSCG